MTDKAMVTDAMVEAVAWSASSQPGQPFGMILTDDDIRNILTIGLENSPAALAQAEQPVAVKPLRWKGPDSSGEYHSLDGLWGYIIRAENGNGFWLTEVGRYFGTPEIAKQYAQADYAERILAALSPSKIEAGENTAETPPPGSRLRGIVEAFLHAHFDGPGLIDAVDNYGDRYTSQFLADTIERARAALATTEGSAE